MCLLNFSWQPDAPEPLILISNRDEFYARATKNLYAWSTTPRIYAGQDLEAQGTWLGITDTGRFAALTNVRDTPSDDKLSRGELVTGFLLSTLSPIDYLTQISEQADHYNGFNLLVADLTPGQRQLAYFSNRNGRSQALLKQGIYGLSNAELDSPWPKLQSTKNYFLNALSKHAHEPLSEDEWLHAFSDTHIYADHQLPQTGVGLDWERKLSAAFIKSPEYGTRAQTLLMVNHDRFSIYERTFLPEQPQASSITTLNARFSF